jgi:capsular polysaccharide biosynthesis protein
MELKKIIEFFVKNIKFIGISTIFAGIVGVGAYFLIPKKHIATGSLFIRRSIYPYSENHFTYEGYYGQQAAMFYANSIIGLIESDDVRAQALKKLDVPVNETTLRKYDRKIKTVKSGPQLVELVIKENSMEEAEKLWAAIADSSIETMNGISLKNDPFVGILKVSEKPILIQTYRSIPICFAVGAGLGFVISTTFFAVSSYFPKKRRFFKK